MVRSTLPANNRYIIFNGTTCCRSDLIKNSRTMGRLIWLHVPNAVSKSSVELSAKEKETEAAKAVSEKKVALELIEA